MTKKSFGTHVTPTDSPVSPERFSGYHTGTDFETFPDEADADVSVFAVCAGPVRFAGRLDGYGGVLIEQCTYRGEPGGVIGVLGKGYSAETDGERKHLHVSVHKGATLDERGYVSTQAALSGWINPFPELGILGE